MQFPLCTEVCNTFSASNLKEQTATYPIFNNFFQTLLLIQILRYLIGIPTVIQTACIYIFREIRHIFPHQKIM